MPSNGLDSRPLEALVASIFISIFISSFPHIMTNGFETQDQPPRPHQRSDSPTPGSSDPAAGEAEPSGEIEPASEPERQAFRTKLSSFVSEYRGKRLSKPKAISNISTLIDGDDALSELEKEKAINLYIEELNSITFGEELRHHLSSARKEKEIDRSVNDLLDEISLGARPTRDDSPEQSDSGEEPPRKRVKAKESDMGWYDPDEPSYRSNAGCHKTCKLLKAYNNDIPGAKFLVKINRRAPSGIPSSQWERILRGEALDLDHFLSSLHRTSINEEGETRIGNAKISLGVSDAKRRVSTAADWSSAWHLASRAVAFAFPHRAEELVSYGDYIESEFAGKIQSSHPRIILFDIAIRNIVQGGHNTLLTDRALHLRFYSAILMPDGVEANTSAAANRRSKQPRAGTSGSKSDICNRFNTANGCPSSESDCRYRHICKKCKKRGHGKEDCSA